MTRKNFVKRLMSLGIERNAANEWAKAAQRSGKSYAEYIQKGIPWALLCFNPKMNPFKWEELMNAAWRVGYECKRAIEMFKRDNGV